MPALFPGTNDTTRCLPDIAAVRSVCSDNRDLAAMVQANQPMHEYGQLRRAECPAFFQQQIVDVLQANAGVLTKNVEGVENFLQIDEPDFPGPLLLLDHRLERGGRRPMPAARVEEYKI